MEHIFIIFDRPPGPEAPRFIEVENEQGESISIGEWVELLERGYWGVEAAALRPDH